ncbi:hypothetical protein C7J88_05880 [Staphylococcus muscae]|uniref:DUF3278 domain-containing protein n=1 Tax=Staphylococcus muscae TaxID=1294 RepID=A0A240C7L8_9STAP|nr:hypothetical protein [Staphylococcus muscae]AVQ33721.1 hypothetical protein C7J88_05880 [Staphylococcus muscae]PNZ03616.1 hypothetical protein CD131_05795 [Staphylococcus muscae]GGA87195.1 hypothetical protein GCM10007183_09180 [Staphylococcus muscae]SNW04081.1 Uncharacterised protein [Staphylococcus muscae]
MSMYKKFAGLTSEPDEYQKSKIDETLALANIMGMLGLGLLATLSLFIDFEMNQLSAFTIGAPVLLFIIGLRSATLMKDYSNHKLYVGTKEEAQQLKRHLKKKGYLYIVLIWLYVVISINILAPILTGQLPYWHRSETLNTLMIIVVPSIILTPSSLNNKVKVRGDE